MRLPKSMINALALAISSALNFLALLLWTRLLSPAEFGVYALYSATALFLNALVFGWLRQSGARLLFDAADELEINREIGDTIAGVTIAISVILGALVALLWYLEISVFGIEPLWWLGIWAWAVAEILFALCAAVARLKLMSWRFFWLMVIRAILSLLISVALVVFFELGILGVVAGQVLSQFIVFFWILGVDPAWRRVRPWKIQRDALRGVLAFGTPLILSIGLTYASGISDRYILTSTLGLEATGQYAVASDLMQKTVIFLMMAINISAYPRIVRAFEAEGQAAGEQHLNRNLVVLLLVACPAATVFSVMAPGVTRLFVGVEFREAVSMLLPWVACAAIARGLLTFHLNVALQAVKKTKMLILAPLITLALLIPAGFAGVAWDGLRGMAICTAASQALGLVVFAQMIRREVRLPMITQQGATVVAISGVLGLGLLPFRSVTDPVIVLMVLTLGLAVYGLAVWRLHPWLMRERAGN